MNWYEQLGRAIAEEAGQSGNALFHGAPIEHQCGTVWVTNPDTGKTIVISAMESEGDEDDTEED